MKVKLFSFSHLQFHTSDKPDPVLKPAKVQYFDTIMAFEALL